MPICEADPWRLQYFADIPCPADVSVPTEDSDAWTWYPRYRWVYDKLRVALSQGLAAAPHGVMPPAFPVFSKPITNLRGMGIDSRAIESEQEYRAVVTPGHFWTELLRGEHVSSDVAVQQGRPVWWRHVTGIPLTGGTFDYWEVHAKAYPEIEAHCGAWIETQLAGYTGLLNLETIGGRIIEAHLRFADQWPDLYGGEAWVRAVIKLYGGQGWEFTEVERRTGYSVVLFGPKRPGYRHPPAELVRQLAAQPDISSIQITFHEDWTPEQHAMPPGGFRLAIVNCYDLAAGRGVRDSLRRVLVGTSE